MRGPPIHAPTGSADQLEAQQRHDDRRDANDDEPEPVEDGDTRFGNVSIEGGGDLCRCQGASRHVVGRRQCIIHRERHRLLAVGAGHDGANRFVGKLDVPVAELTGAPRKICRAHSTGGIEADSAGWQS